LNHPRFIDADIVHYHLIHNNLISILDMPFLARAKPSVWTMHDPWFFTGGCIHPLECSGYERACGECALSRFGQMFAVKKHVYQSLNIDFVAASRFTMEYFRASPIARHFERVHFIPFGIDVFRFRTIGKVAARERFKIRNEELVVAFRAEASLLKGCRFIYEALRLLDLSDKITLLTVGSARLPEDIASRYNAVQLGWSDDEETLYAFYAATDIFLMPSLAESFGLMAIEAMAAGCVPVVLKVPLSWMCRLHRIARFPCLIRAVAIWRKPFLCWRHQRTTGRAEAGWGRNLRINIMILTFM
jgi:glycosyltransferase involved in cell wall biosynthesis